MTTYVSGSKISRFPVEVVSTPAALQKGLSDRKFLMPRHGMLFKFVKEGVQSMWMPNMNFPLDIVWLDSSKTIVKIIVNVQPCEGGGTHNCKSYSSVYPTLYAIELNAFDASQIGLHVGLQLIF
jgi:uncharacterized membrane protein (UPF0127 family)